MASLTFEFDNRQFKFMAKLRQMFPELRAQTLGYIGSEGKKRLKRRLLSGQEIDLRAYPYDRKGRRTISYSVGRGAKSVKIASFPVNLFEGGRKLRSGIKEPGKKIIGTKFKQIMMSDLQNIANQADAKLIQRKIGNL